MGFGIHSLSLLTRASGFCFCFPATAQTCISQASVCLWITWGSWGTVGGDREGLGWAWTSAFPVSVQVTQLNWCSQGPIQQSSVTSGWVWWCVPLILALRRLRQGDVTFQASLGCSSLAVASITLSSPSLLPYHPFLLPFLVCSGRTLWLTFHPVPGSPAPFFLCVEFFSTWLSSTLTRYLVPSN